MNFRDFAELREFIRRYNSTSILEVGTQKCWHHWESNYSSYLDWLSSNNERNCAIRLMLLASAGNPHRNKNIKIQEFNNLINVYHGWDKHTISDERILNEEAQILFDAIQKWENSEEKERVVRNWSLKLSDVLSLELIRKHVAGLFIQRVGAFQNAGFGYPGSRVKRTIKFIELLDIHSNENFSRNFLNHTKLRPTEYFNQFVACLGLFTFDSSRKGFFDASRFPNISRQVQNSGITQETLEDFIQQNSATFTGKANFSFRRRLSQAFNDIPDFYQLLFYNLFLETPIVSLDKTSFCLPDPFSFIDSSWNQVRSLVLENGNIKNPGKLLSDSFEAYFKDVLLPYISPNSFQKIPEVKNSTSSEDKRADFLIEALNSYIIIECKNSVMSSNTSAYLLPNKVADLWCRTHSACEQISATIKALGLQDKAVIPLVMSFYDSIAASAVFEEIIKETSYCSHLGLTMPPIVRSLHEFEHFIHDRSLNNWTELILSQQNKFSFAIKPDNGGHNYEHLSSIHALQIASE